MFAPICRYEFDTYREKSLTFYTILMSYADEVQAVSIDEALVDVSQRVAELEQAPPEMHLDSQTRPDFAKLLAEDIRADMREGTDCEGESTWKRLAGAENLQIDTDVIRRLQSV